MSFAEHEIEAGIGDHTAEEVQESRELAASAGGLVVGGLAGYEIGKIISPVGINRLQKREVVDHSTPAAVVQQAYYNRVNQEMKTGIDITAALIVSALGAAAATRLKRELRRR